MMELEGVTFQNRLADALPGGELMQIYRTYEMQPRQLGKRPPSVANIHTSPSPPTSTKLPPDTIINVIIFGLLYYSSFSLG